MNHNILHENVVAFREFCVQESLVILSEREIQSGHQFQVSDGQSKISVSLYSTGKGLIQGKDSDQKTRITTWWTEQSLGKQNLSPSLSTEISKDSTAKFIVPVPDFESLKQLLFEAFNEHIELKQSLGDSGTLYRAVIHNAHQRVMVTQYKNGTFLVQGRLGELFENVCKTLESMFPQSFAERSARYVPDSSRELIADNLNEPRLEQNALEWSHDQLTQKVYEFLFPNDQRAYLSAAGLLLSIKETNLILSDYSVVVMPFARAYEGFLIRLANVLQITNSKKIEVKRYLDKIQDKISTNSRNNDDIADVLLLAWTVRNKVMHSDTTNPPPHHRLIDAEHDIYQINRAICRGYEYLVERGIHKPSN